MSDQDRQIALRVRQVRYANQLSQPAFAHALGITIDRVASIEYGRTPLSVGVADKIASKFDVSLIWLVEGRGRMKPCVGLILNACPKIKASERLSEVFTQDVVKSMQDESRFAIFALESILAKGKVELPDNIDVERLLDQFHHHLVQTIGGLPHRKKHRLIATLIAALAEFTTDFELGQMDTIGDKRVESLLLHHFSVFANNDSVKTEPQLPGLLDRLKEATKERGMKSALAQFLGVPLANVSQWLAGDREPGGEYVLQMQEWLRLPPSKRKAK